MQQPYCIYFRFWGFPVTVQPFFWLLAVFLGRPDQITNLAVDLMEIAVWVAAVFVAILVHELGHALVFRHLFRVNASIVLHGMGGYAMPSYPPQRKRGWRGFWSFILLDAAGVGAGFLLALLAYLIFLLIPSTADDNIAAMMVKHWLLNIVGIGIVWGIFNLLPIIPLDGGRISQEICSALMPRRGHRVALCLSLACTTLLTVLAVKYGEIFLIIIFGYFAYHNYQELAWKMGRPPRF